MKDGEGDGKDLQIKELQSKVGELTMLLELERRKDRKIGGQPPFGALRGQGDEFRRYGPSEKKPYGVERVRKGWQTSATVYRRMKEASRTSDDRPPRPRKRPGPDGPMPDAQIDAIEQVEWMSFGDSPFHGEGYRKVRAWLMQGHRHIACASLAAHARNNDLLAKSCREPAPSPCALTTEPSSPSISR